MYGFFKITYLKNINNGINAKLFNIKQKQGSFNGNVILIYLFS